MLITAEILSIPPHLSTSWKNILSLHASPSGEQFTLAVALNNGTTITVPTLNRSEIDAIFLAHARYGSNKLAIQPQKFDPASPVVMGNIDLLNESMQHNPAQAGSPEIPKEILEKIAAIIKAVNADEAPEFPKPEPHCNCPFCQIARVFHGIEMTDKPEEIVSEDDLRFRSWDIKQTADKLYQVTNPLDAKEQYNVFLGEPIGCTCGQKNCEHIRAVLNS